MHSPRMRTMQCLQSLTAGTKSKKLLKEKRWTAFLCERHRDTQRQCRRFGFLNQPEYLTGSADAVLCQPGSGVKKHERSPGKHKNLTTSLSETISPRKEVSLTSADTDTYDQYFYNLIAMACLYTALGGIRLAIENAANLTSLAARKQSLPRGNLRQSPGSWLPTFCLNPS